VSNIKPGVSKAKRMMMHSRKPFEILVELQQGRISKLTARIGHLMTQRADAEEVLAELLELKPRAL
jgi:flagellar biosynthesis chaperone FliJ